MSKFAYPLVHDDAKYSTVEKQKVTTKGSIRDPSKTFIVERQKVTRPSEVFFRVIYTDADTGVGGTIHITFEGDKAGSRACFQQTVGSLRSGREPVVMGRGLREPHSKTSLGPKKFRQLKQSGELYDMRRSLIDQSLTEFDPELAARELQERESAARKYQTELEAIPTFGMF